MWISNSGRCVCVCVLVSIGQHLNRMHLIEWPATNSQQTHWEFQIHAMLMKWIHAMENSGLAIRLSRKKLENGMEQNRTERFSQSCLNEIQFIYFAQCHSHTHTHREKLINLMFGIWKCLQCLFHTRCTQNLQTLLIRFYSLISILFVSRYFRS